VDLQEAIAALRLPGAVVLYPTETVYGLGSRVVDAMGVRRIHALKQSAEQAQIVLIDGVPSWLDGLAEDLARAFWPGPLTLVVEPPVGFALAARARDGSLAIRWSPHPVVQELVSELGPITSTSANVHGQLPIRLPGDLAFEVDAVIDVGPLPVSRPTTLVDSRTGVLLREGELSDQVRLWMDDRDQERL
jgi:L-threonylcarbamoyladenylate synthase